MAQILMNNHTTDLIVKLESLPEEDVFMCFLWACETNYLILVQVVARTRPNIAWLKNQNGQHGIHVASEYGNDEIVEALAKSDPNLCFLRDKCRRNALDIATVGGKIQVMKALLKECPRLLGEKTYLGETALHLAAKHDQIEAFKVLMDEILKHKQEMILHLTDWEGNNVFHIAIDHKLIQIIQWLLVENPKRGPLVPVNCRNGRGLTAFDLHRLNFTEQSDLAITLLLHQVGASWEQSSPRGSMMNKDDQRFSNSPVLLTACVLTAGSTYTSIFSLNGACVGTTALTLGETILRPDHLPLVFYSIMLMTLAFLASMVGITLFLWPIVKQWSIFDRALVLLLLGSFIFSYAFIMGAKVPKFWITADSFKISSFWFVWLYGLSLILVLVTTWLVAKQILRIVCKLKHLAKND